MRKKDSNIKEKRKCKVKYTKKTRQKVQYMAGTEFNTKENISYYVNVRTNGWKSEDFLEIVSTYCVGNLKKQGNIFYPGCKMLASSEYLARYLLYSAYGDGCCMGKRTKSLRLACEMVSRKVKKRTCFT